MVEVHEQSLINLAEGILEEKNEPVDLYDLFDMVLEKSAADFKDISDILNAFYADLSSSAKFIYMGNNSWDLKKHQKIELWDKDGSFYNEYKEVSDEDLDNKLAKQHAAEHAHQKMLEERRLKAEVEAEKARQAESEASEKPVEAADPDPIEAKDIAEIIDKITDEEQKLDDKAETLDEVDEEYEDFDEEEYNEYMDTYEEEYDK